jgi:type VI secretion system protein ImpA
MEISEITIADGRSICDFLRPLSAEHPAGGSLQETASYTEIQEARASDDPSLPMGVWERELKKSDWSRVSKLTQMILLEKSKDLQIAIWFAEAQVHLHGIVKLPACILLLAELTNTFWDDIHPLMDGGDVEYRTNLFAWMNDKLPMVIRQVTLAESVSGETYTWIDWERALHEQSGLSESAARAGQGSLGVIKQAVDQTNIAFYQELFEDLSDSIIALEYLSEMLGGLLASDAPSLAGLSGLLASQRDTIVDLTSGRSLLEGADTEIDVEGLSSEEQAGSSQTDTTQEMVVDRQRAYAQLAEAAEYLLRDDPHSPVPHLVYKAIEWGRLSTPDLYHEIFIRHEGNLNIFDVLGIDRTKAR